VGKGATRSVAAGREEGALATPKSRSGQRSRNGATAQPRKRRSGAAATRRQAAGGQAFQEPIELDSDPDRANDKDYVQAKYDEVRASIQRGMDALARRRRLPLFG
jgi:hypothetical protein